MLVSSVSAPQKAEDALCFSMELKAVRFASVVTTTVRVKERRTSETRAQTTTPTGAQAGYAIPTDTEDLLRSYAERGLDSDGDGNPDASTDE